MRWAVWTLSLMALTLSVSSEKRLSDGLRSIIDKYKMRLRNNVTRAVSSGDALVSRLAQDIYDVEMGLGEGPDGDKFHDGVMETTESIYLFGERKRSHNISTFCGDLLGKQMNDVPIEFRRGIQFTPRLPLTSPVQNLTLSIPSDWFRLDENGLHDGIRFYVCFEGQNWLRLEKTTILQSDFVTRGIFSEYQYNHQFLQRLGIRGMALILDNKWNNAYLLPRGIQASVSMDSRSEVQRRRYTDSCNPELGMDQPCCLWRFRIDLHLLFPDIPISIPTVFHRCVGRPPRESLHIPFIDDGMMKLFQRGRLSRRLIAPPSTTCRESKFHERKFYIRNHNAVVENIQIKEKIEQALRKLDATECAVFY